MNTTIPKLALVLRCYMWTLAKDKQTLECKRAATIQLGYVTSYHPNEMMLMMWCYAFTYSRDTSEVLTDLDWILLETSSTEYKKLSFTETHKIALRSFRPSDKTRW